MTVLPIGGDTASDEHQHGVVIVDHARGMATPGARLRTATGAFNFAAPTVATGISHSSETSYYAGGGLKVGF